MDWLNYHHLHYFWVVAREGSVRRASELLHLTPATISIQLRDLERSLGAKLFQKSGRGLALTPSGESVYRYASEIFALGQEMQEVVRGQPSGRPRLLRIGIRDVMPKLVAYKLMEPTFLLEDAPRVVCHEGDVGRLVAELSVHRLDVVLSDTPLDPTLKVRVFSHLLGESDVVVMSTRALAGRVTEGFPGSLHGAPFLLPTENTVLRRSLDLWFSENGIRPLVRGEFEDSAMLKEAGRAGIGAFAAPAAIRTELESMYGVVKVGTIAGVKERFFALSVERRIKHPAVMAIWSTARQRLSHQKGS